MEIVFSVTQEADGNTLEELRSNVLEAVNAYFFDQPKPSRVRLHLVYNEVLACA